jgi:YidC/Oxa1 family membrane protein insertase
MASLPVPAMLDESVLWINDLTISDPYYMLPVVTSAFMYMTLKVSHLLAPKSAIVSS